MFLGVFEPFSNGFQGLPAQIPPPKKCTKNHVTISPHNRPYNDLALSKYPGYGTGQRWTMKPGNLEAGFWWDQ